MLANLFVSARSTAVFVAAVLLMVAPLANAQDAKTTKPDHVESSRIGRVFTADVGGGYSSGPARFAMAGVYINPDWVVEGYYEESKTWFFGESTSRGLRSRNFWAAQLYTTFGLIHRDISGRNMFLDMAASSFTGVDTHYEIEYWDVGPEFAVGSQWQWSAFKIGVDWAGIYWPLHASTAEITKTENSVVTSTKARDDIKPEPSARLLRLYLGFSL